MARKVELQCDICGKATKRIVGKILLVPSNGGITRLSYANYSHHADVGECCMPKLQRGFKWRKRLTAAQYQQSRKAG